MFEVQVSPEVIEYAERLLAHHSLGRRGIGDGSREQQMTGLVGEVTLKDLFGIPRREGATGPDGGVDFVYANLTIDVKTMGRTVRPQGHHVNNFSALQRHFPTDLLLFCSLNKRIGTLTVCGWIEKDEFLRKASFYPAGTVRTRGDGTTFRIKAGLYEIRNQDLHSPKTLSALKADLSQVARRAARREEPLAA